MTLDAILFNELPTRSRQVASHHRRSDSEEQAEPEECVHAMEASQIHKTVAIQNPARREVNARVRCFAEGGLTRLSNQILSPINPGRSLSWIMYRLRYSIVWCNPQFPIR